jgi:hypothetical protein
MNFRVTLAQVLLLALTLQAEIKTSKYIAKFKDCKLIEFYLIRVEMINAFKK